MSLEDFAKAPARHQSLYDTIAQSHPSLMNGIVWCRHCRQSRTVDPAKWPARGLAEVLQRHDVDRQAGRGEALTKHSKLSAREIWMLIYIAERRGLSGRMILSARQRERAVPLWRRELVEIWWKQVAGECQRGPYFSLSVDGHRLACAILAARDDRRRSKSEGASPSTERPSALAA